MINKIISIILKPFKEDLFFFLELWIFASAADVFFWALHGNPIFGLYMGIHGFIYCYIICLIVGLLPKRIQRISKCILLVLGFINLIIDACVHHIQHFGFTKDMVAIILGSNPTEASEFLPLYFDKTVIYFTLSCCILVLGIHICSRYINSKKLTLLPWLLFAFLIIFTSVVTIRKSRNWEGLFLNKVYLFLSYDTPVDFNQFRKDTQLVSTGDHPNNIVLIIGEALSRRHCSLYGYHLETTPNLDRMASDSSIIVFNNIVAPYINTVEVFTRLMSTYDNSKGEQKPQWDQEYLLGDVMQDAGYKTYWISNQSSSGFWDNIIAKFAALSDVVEWVGPKGLSLNKTNPDEDVIPFIEESLSDNEINRFFVIHLMGNHENFVSRYPPSYSYFSQTNYQEEPESQRRVLSEYDNSIRYGDFVVSEILSLFENTESLVFFFPDHSLDIYDTDPTYVGHARPEDPASYLAGTEIPFIVYPTNSYIEKHPDEIIRLKQSSNTVFNTEDMIYTILDIANFQFADDNSVEEHSLLTKEQYED